ATGILETFSARVIRHGPPLRRGSPAHFMPPTLRDPNGLKRAAAVTEPGGHRENASRPGSRGLWRAQPRDARCQTRTGNLCCASTFTGACPCRVDPSQEL